MRRLYMAPFPVWDTHRDYFHDRIGSHYIHLIAYASQANAELLNTNPSAWAALPEVVAWQAAGGMLLISTSFDHSEFAEDIWTSHPDVAILPHPTLEGSDPLSKHLNSKTKKIQQKHLDALAIIGITTGNTVWDVSDRASGAVPAGVAGVVSSSSPQCKLRAVL